MAQRTSIAKTPYNFAIFSGTEPPYPPPLWIRAWISYKKIADASFALSVCITTNKVGRELREMCLSVSNMY